MNVSTLLKAGSLSCLVVTCWACPLGAIGDCVSALRIDAPAAVHDTMRARLRQGRLSQVPADHCRNAVIHLESKGQRWELEFNQGDTSIQRDVKSPELAAVWVESWLLPAASIDAPPQPLLDGSATKGEAAVVNTPRAATAPIGFEATVALLGAAGSAWLGPGLRFHSNISGHWWLEPHARLGYAVTHRPSEASRVMTVGTAFGRDVLRTPNWFLRPGGDIGFMNVRWQDRPTDVRLAGPTLGAQFSIGYSLGRSIWLVGRANGMLLFADRTQTDRLRVCTDNWCDDTERMDVVTSARNLSATWVGGVDLGLLIHLGDLT